MRPLILAVFLGLAALPALGQTTQAPTGSTLPDETRQALDRAEMLFKFVKMFIDYLPAYETPTILPNGDILIRRKPPAPPETTRTAPATPAAAQKKS
jgi:hypothetical protein